MGLDLYCVQCQPGFDFICFEASACSTKQLMFYKNMTQFLSNLNIRNSLPIVGIMSDRSGCNDKF